jgi:hypothetical protein
MAAITMPTAITTSPAGVLDATIIKSTPKTKTPIVTRPKVDTLLFIPLLDLLNRFVSKPAMSASPARRKASSQVMVLQYGYGKFASFPFVSPTLLVGT